MEINQEKCSGCGYCEGECEFEAIKRNEKGKFYIEKKDCAECGQCTLSCMVDAIEGVE